MKVTSNEKKVLLYIETTYKTDLASYATPAAILAIQDSSMNPSVEPITSGIKTNTNAPTICEELHGRESGTGTINGSIIEGYFDVLMEIALHNGTANPKTISEGKTAITFQVIEMYNDGSATVVNVARGCRVDTFSTSGSGNNLVNFSLSYTANSVKKTDTITLTSIIDYDDVVVPCPSVSFSDVIFSTLADVNSFDLTLNNNYASDDIVYQNNDTKQAEYFIGQTGEFNYTRIYDTTNAVPVANIYGGSVVADRLTIAGKNLTIKYQITSPDTPDNSKDLVIQTVNSRLATSGSDVAFSYDDA